MNKLVFWGVRDVLSKLNSDRGFDLCGRQLDNNSVVFSRAKSNMKKFSFTKWDIDDFSPCSRYYYCDRYNYHIKSLDSDYGIILEDFNTIVPRLVKESNFDMGIYKKNYIDLTYSDLKLIVSKLNPKKKMIDLLNKELFIGDLVIYIDSNKFMYGIVISDKSIFSQAGLEKKVSFVYKIKNLTSYEFVIRDKLKQDYLNVMNNTMLNKEGNVGAIYKFGSDYYINLGKRSMSYQLLRETDIKFDFTVDESRILWGKFSWNSNKFFSEDNGWSDNELLDSILIAIKNSALVSSQKYFISENFFSNYKCLYGFKYLLNVNTDNLNKLKFKRKIKLPKDIVIFYADYKIILTEI